MDLLLLHLPNSAKLSGAYDKPDRLRKYLERFFRSELRFGPKQIGQNWDLRFRPVLIGSLRQLMQKDGLKVLATDAGTGVVRATFDATYKTSEAFFPKAQFPMETIQLRYVVEARIVRDGTGLIIMENAELPSWTSSIAGNLKAKLDELPGQLFPGTGGLFDTNGPSEAASRSPPVKNLPPGKALRSIFESGLNDYSGCAEEAEVQDMGFASPSGAPRVLPLGRFYRFEGDGAHKAKAPVLYLRGTSARKKAEGRGVAPAETPDAYRGALVVAPQDSGKTKLILRWAKAANRGGYSQFIVDVKGNLYPQLKGQLAGKVYHFTTEPGAASDRINFLAGLGKPNETLLAWQLRQLANAILPSEGFEEGEQLYYLQNRTNWLMALTQIMKLIEWYTPFKGRSADLSDLYGLIADPTMLCSAIRATMALETTESMGATFGGLRRWVRSASLLFDPREVPGGQRPPNNTYQEFAQGMLTPLNAFGVGGILFDKIRGGADLPGQLFSLEELDHDEQVTIVMTAREQELDDAVTVVSMAVKRLQNILFGRMGKLRRPILLLLDETRRIRNFQPGQYITFAREAQAGCVIVYQSLDQIKDEGTITEILENVGTQIYLRSIVGNSARRFIEFLPKRYRKTFSRTGTLTDAGEVTGAVTEQQELIDYFTTADLFRLPSGRRSALVYLNDHPSGKPFLVDMDEEHIPALS